MASQYISPVSASSYSSGRSESTLPFISYFASTTPDSEHKRVRLKTALFLQASALYDVESIRSRLLPQEKIFKFEIAILDGKVSESFLKQVTLVYIPHFFL